MFFPSQFTIEDFMHGNCKLLSNQNNITFNFFLEKGKGSFCCEIVLLVFKIKLFASYTMNFSRKINHVKYT